MEASSKADHFFTPSLRGRIPKRLLRWFDRHRRDLPWRINRDPYRIWISEVMLQQTQVSTALRYFDRFIRAFPSIKALAATTEQDVLREWEGMGYYRRARHLHQAARRLSRDHGGRIPNDPEIFGSMPGVGRYILGAVLSQAFDRRLPIALCRRRSLLVESVVDYFLGLSRQHRFSRRFLPSAVRLAVDERQIARGRDCARSEFVDQTSNCARGSGAALFHS